MKSIVLVVFALFLSELVIIGPAMAQIAPAYCDYNELISNQGSIIYRFSFKSDCARALEEARTSKGFFCDWDKLALPNGYIVHDFNWNENCQEALSSFRESETGLFCDDTGMYQVRFGFLVSHSYASYCKEAVIDARDHKGLFCREGQMFNQWGQQIRDYSFRSSCLEALKKITSGK